MIVEWLAQIGLTITNALAGVFGTFELAPWMQESVDAAMGFVQSASGLGVWVPWAMISTILGSLVLVYGSGFAVQLVQKIWGNVPVVGGAG